MFLCLVLRFDSKIFDFISGVDIDPVLISRCCAHSTHPSHVTYRQCDVMDPSQRDAVLTEFFSQHEDAQEFDLVACFSVTLWIHLHHGDEGLRTFLRFVCKRSKHLLIEPQPYKCYKSAVRRMKRANCDGFPQFNSLLWKHDVDEKIIEFVVEECGMTLERTLGHTHWDRKMCFFSKNNQ